MKNTELKELACNGNRYCEVEQNGELSEHGGDSKVASTKIKIGVSAAVSSSDYSAAVSSSDYSAAVSLGNYSAAVNSGDQSAAVILGNYSAAKVSSGGSVAIVTGCQSKAKAGLGSAIVIAERGDWNGEIYPLINIKAAIVDGEKIKADTWYTLQNGEFVEA